MTSKPSGQRWKENCKGEINLKINIEGNIYLESDEHQFMLKRYGNTYINKEGEEVQNYTVIGYYPTIERAINSFITKKLLDSQATTLKELKQDVESIREFVKSKIDF